MPLTERASDRKYATVYSGASFWVRLIFLEVIMNTRVAVIGIIVENLESVEKLNAILSEYGENIIGRMGIPYKEKNVNCITVVIDAEQNAINTLCGKIGKLDGVSSKAAFSNV